MAFTEKHLRRKGTKAHKTRNLANSSACGYNIILEIQTEIIL